jgi:pimeloyl-ACP methyl ester carboxylesterase
MRRLAPLATRATPLVPIAFPLQPVLTLVPFFLSACAVTLAIPPWFDSIQRLPVKTVLVNGNRIAYLDAGDGPPVILVHGFGGSLWQWEYQQSALSAAHRVITLDLPGSGFSDKPDIAYGPDEMVAFFRAFMDAVGLSRASLVGNSMGAGLVIGMALAYPNRVDRLVLIGGFPDRVREKLASPLIRRALDSRASVWVVRIGNWLLGRGLTESVLTEIVHDPTLLTPAVIERAYQNRQRPGLIPPLMAMARTLPLWEEGYAKRLGEVRQPTLILWGAEDKVFPPQVGRDLHETMAGSTFQLIPEAGHIPQWERPDVVNPLLLAFLRP